MAQENGNEHKRVTVGTSEVTLIGKEEKGRGSVDVPRSVLIKNKHATNILYIGLATGVTSSDGFGLDPGESVALDTHHTDIVYGIADGASTPVHILILHGTTPA